MAVVAEFFINLETEFGVLGDPVQRSALLRLGDQMMLFVQKGKATDGQVIFERRRVAIDDDEDGQWVPVTHGLNPGEVVVSKGGIELLGMI